MKNLKLVFTILIGLLVFTSCGTDDGDTPEPTPMFSEIIGVWNPVKTVEVCSTGSEMVYELDPCEQRGTMSFNGDGTMSITTTEAYMDMCRQIYEATGTWTITNDNLTITIAGETLTPAYFELTSDLLRMGENDFDEDDRCGGDNLPDYYYTEYIRKN